MSKHRHDSDYLDNASVAQETIRITKAGEYERDGECIPLPGREGYSFASAEVICAGQEQKDTSRPQYETQYVLMNRGSFSAARKMLKEGPNVGVLNFANAVNPGGGFLGGAQAQEECLCRESTLYASLTSPEAASFYAHNRECVGRLYTNCLIYSPDVAVFRNGRLKLRKKPFVVSVLTQAAPNLHSEGRYANTDDLKEDMLSRMRLMMRTAADKGIERLVLGAWGCGAFGHDTEKVAEEFHQVLIEEGMGAWFRTVVFAVCGSNAEKHLEAFRNAFSKETAEPV